MRRPCRRCPLKGRARSAVHTRRIREWLDAARTPAPCFLIPTPPGVAPGEATPETVCVGQVEYLAERFGACPSAALGVRPATVLSTLG